MTASAIDEGRCQESSFSYHFSTAGYPREPKSGLNKVKNADSLEKTRFSCHNTRIAMTKTELQNELATATQTNKRTAALFL
ncbi:MAG: hypothetical protein WAM44_17300, partial [Chthoniobacterales bacterium]